jgi:outer membrane protein assembly factor BamB
MPAAHTLRLSLVTLGAIISPLIGLAADCPQWGGQDGRNMVCGEKGLVDWFEPGKKSPQGDGIDMATTQNVKWVVRLGSQTYGNPTIAHGRVFVGTNDEDLSDPRFEATRGGLLKCLDEATGKLLWQLVVPKRTGMPPTMLFDHLALGVCSAPTVDGDRIYIVTNRNEVVCLDINGMADGNQGPFVDEAHFAVPSDKPPVPPGAKDADILWRFDMIDEGLSWPQDAANCSIVVHGDLVYVCTANGVDKSHDKVPLPLAPSLIVLEKKTGRLVGVDDEKIGTRLFHGQWCSPSLGTVGDKSLLFFGGGDGICYAFETMEAMSKSPSLLKKAWSYDCNPPEFRFKDGEPIHYRDGDKRRKHGNTNDGSFVGPSEIIATPVFYNNRIYVAVGQDPSHGRGKGILHCIDATKTDDITHSGKIWSYTDIDRTISTVSIADGLLYIADVAGRLHCLDAETGKPYWVYDTKAEIWGSTLVADGKVYLGTKKDLLVFAAGKEAKLINEIYLGSPMYNTPVAANGVLYIASQRYLWAVEKRD